LVSVIIPTLNAGPGFLELLEAIHAQQVPGGVQTVVIDSGSRDGTLDLAHQSGARVLSIPRRRFNHGLTRNWAIQESRGGFVALTVQDALPADEHWLSNLLDPLLQDSVVGASYGLQEAPASAGFLARVTSALWRNQNTYPLVKSVATPTTFDRMRPVERLELIRFDNVTSCVRRGVWEKLPFPERDYGEDMAWAKEALLAGFRIAYVPTARVWHCHERGWIHQLRRAYLDGYARVELVGWPSPELSFEGALALLNKLMSLVVTRRFDALVKPSAIREFLSKEVCRCESLGPSKTAELYCEALEFSEALLRASLVVSNEKTLPEGAWADLLRFSMAGVTGRNLGAAARSRLDSGFSLERIEWCLLHRLLSRGV
jgi:rhamnosyltransferase